MGEKKRSPSLLSILKSIQPQVQPCVCFVHSHNRLIYQLGTQIDTHCDYLLWQAPAGVGNVASKCYHNVIGNLLHRVEYVQTCGLFLLSVYLPVIY